MKERAQRLAWIITLVGFLCFCVLGVGIPLSVRWYIRHAQQDYQVSVESLQGTVVVEPPVGSGPIPLTKGQTRSVPAGTAIYVDETSEAVITFFDHSFMRLFPDTHIRMQTLSAPRYRAGLAPTRIAFRMLSGRVRVGTALPFMETPLEFSVSTPYGEASLDADGSYGVQIMGESFEIATYRGGADVVGAGRAVRLDPRERTVCRLGSGPEPPKSLAKNLIANGDFTEPLDPWRVFNDQGTDGGDVDGEVEIVIDGGRRAIKLSRTGGYGNHCETILEQTIDEVLPDPLTSMVVRATVKVRYQGLSGGGYLASEYPLMIRITYRDIYDSEAEWVQGFYYQNVDENPTTHGLRISRDSWYLYESPNLVEELPVTPYRIVKIRVYAAGWDYESLISDINLIVE